MSIDKQELVRRVSQRVERETSIVETVIDATIEEIYESLQQGNSVSLELWDFLRQGRAEKLGVQV